MHDDRRSPGQHIEIANPPGNDGRFVVMAHGGPGGSLDGPGGLFTEIAVQLEKRRIGSLRFDFFGEGGRADAAAYRKHTTLALQAAEIRTVISVAQAMGCTRLGVLGESLGAASLLVDWPSETKTAVLLWPLLNFMDDTHQLLPNLLMDDRFGQPFLDEVAIYGDLMNRLRHVDCPVLMVHANDDQEVRLSSSAEALEEFPAAQLQIVTGGHGMAGADHGQRQEVVREIASWFEETLAE